MNLVTLIKGLIRQACTDSQFDILRQLGNFVDLHEQ